MAPPEYTFGIHAITTEEDQDIDRCIKEITEGPTNDETRTGGFQNLVDCLNEHLNEGETVTLRKSDGDAYALSTDEQGELQLVYLPLEQGEGGEEIRIGGPTVH